MVSEVTGRRRGKRPARSRVILVLGGASSGKSKSGLSLAAAGRSRLTPRAFVATAQPFDREMTRKITRHRAARGESWHTEEVPIDLVTWFQKHGPSYRVIVLDCITLWISNLVGQGFQDQEVLDLARDLSREIRSLSARVVIISNELGLGLVPAQRQSRRFRDLAGRVNQVLANDADEAYFVISGIRMRIT